MVVDGSVQEMNRPWAFPWGQEDVMMRVWRGLPLRASLLVAVLTILVFGGSAMAQTEAAVVERSSSAT